MAVSLSQEIFGLLLWVFRKLENASAPSFQRYVSVLDTVSQVRLASTLFACLTANICA